MKKVILLGALALTPLLALVHADGDSNIFSNTTIGANSRFEFTLNTTARDVAVDVSSNLVNWSEFMRLSPQSSPSTNIFDDAIPSVGQRFYRAISNPAELQAVVQGDFGLPAGTTVTLAPGDLSFTQKDDQTFKLGARFLPVADQYSIVASAPGFISQTQTVSAVDFHNGGHLLFSFSTAPTSLAGLSFDYGLGITGTIAFSTTGNSYSWIIPGLFFETGTYSASRTANVWTVTARDAMQMNMSSVQFVFAASDSGTIVVSRPGSINPDVGTFTRSSQSLLTPGFAPPTISSISVRTDPSSVIGQQMYTAAFSGGIFVFTQAGGAGLTGPFQYTVTGPNTAHLVLHYTAPFTGDLDDMTLTFNGFGFGTLQATSIVSGQTGPVLGTFSNLQ